MNKDKWITLFAWCLYIRKEHLLLYCKVCIRTPTTRMEHIDGIFYQHVNIILSSIYIANGSINGKTLLKKVFVEDLLSVGIYISNL